MCTVLAVSYVSVVVCMCFCRPEAKVPRLMGSSYGAPRGRFQRGGFGYRGPAPGGGAGGGGFGRGWSGGGYRGNAPGFGGGGGMRPFGANRGQRQPGFGGSGFGSWGRGMGRGGGAYAGGNWSASMDSGNASGMSVASSAGFGNEFGGGGGFFGGGRGRGLSGGYDQYDQ